jgi:hypothetical protein
VRGNYFGLTTLSSTLCAAMNHLLATSYAFFRGLCVLFRIESAILRAYDAFRWKGKCFNVSPRAARYKFRERVAAFFLPS